jgi:hypothetical protein
MNSLKQTSTRKAQKTLWLALTILLGILSPTGCNRPTVKPGLVCTLVELRPNPNSRYYDAVVRLESVTVRNPLKDNFQAMTPSSAFDLASLNFTVEGQDASMLEAGDTFVVPLKRPDWRYSIWEGETEYCTENFSDRLPPADRWHPTKTEATEVARSVEVTNEGGALKPLPTFVPPEWRLVEETLPAVDSPVGSLLYQKLRGGRIVEQVEIQYAQLTEEELAQITAGSPADFLANWSECAKNGIAVEIAGHSAIACDMEGVGEFGWTYRYFYISSEMVLALDVQSDPQELGKTEEEKELERRTDQIFLRCGYGPVGKEQWQVMIEIRMNRTGAFHRRSRAGDIVDKDFKVSDEEFAAIEKALADNNFMNLESRSAAGAGLESFIAIRDDTRARTVNMKNVRDPLFENIAAAIRRIVLPKVDENGMQPPAR